VPVAVGVPEISASPLPWSTTVSPAGSVPTSVIEAMGAPVVVTAKAPDWLRVKKAVAPLVMVGGPDVATVTVRASVATLPVLLVAEMDTGKVPAPPSWRR
jgi:hypothetical protein